MALPTIEVHALTVQEAVQACLQTHLATTVAELQLLATDQDVPSPRDEVIELVEGSGAAPAHGDEWVHARLSTFDERPGINVGVSRTGWTLELACGCLTVVAEDSATNTTLRTTASKRVRLLARAVQVTIQRYLQGWSGSGIDLVRDLPGQGVVTPPDRPAALECLVRFEVWQKTYNGYA